MRKDYFLACTLLISSIFSAQHSGIKGGMNVSNLSTNDSQIDTSSKIGFNAGVFFNLPLSSKINLQPEVLFNKLGSKYKTSFFSGDQVLEGVYVRNLNYISLPVMMQYNASPAFYLEAGPQMSLLVSAYDSSPDIPYGTAGSIKKTAVKDIIQTFDFGVGLGLGYNINKNLGLNARYVAGVTDVLKYNSGDAVTNNNFQIGLYYKFAK